MNYFLLSSSIIGTIEKQKISSTSRISILFEHLWGKEIHSLFLQNMIALMSWPHTSCQVVVWELCVYHHTSYLTALSRWGWAKRQPKQSPSQKLNERHSSHNWKPGFELGDLLDCGAKLPALKTGYSEHSQDADLLVTRMKHLQALHIFLMILNIFAKLSKSLVNT